MLLSALATLGNIGASVYGAIKSAQANNDAQRIAENQHAENVGVLQSRMSRNLTNGADFQNALTKWDKLAQTQAKRTRQTNAVSGGTDESVALQKQINAQAQADALANMGAQSVAYKDNTQNALLTENQAFSNQMANLARSQGQQIAQASGQVGKAMGGIISADANTLGDDLAMFGLDTSMYERTPDGHLVRKANKGVGV